MKRNLRKYLSGMLSALLFVACILTPVNAHASSGLAVSAGKNFGDGVDTRQDAIDASTAYGNAGYSTVTLQSPTKSDFTSENLSADILFLSGHGNADVLSFGTYKIVCQSGTASSSYTNLQNTASNQKLITFAGCNTAGGGDKNGGSGSTSDNITKRVVDQGADAAVGWTTTVSAGSHTNWLKRYNNSLAGGKTVSQAINDANSYIYLPGSGVKNAKYYGNGNLTITSSKSSSSNQQSDMSLLNYDDNNATFEEIVKLALTNNESFDTEKYLGYIYDADDGYVVDVYYKNRDIVTNVAITLYIGTTGEIREIKPHNIPTKSLSNIPIILSKEAITSASESFKSRIAVEEQGKIRSSERVSNQVQFEYYDVTEKTTYLITYTEITDDIGAKYITETVSPIK